MQSNPGKIFVQSLFLQQNAEKAAAQSPVQRPSSGCASRSRTYDGGVKVPCLTAWRWRIMQNSITYFPLFHKRCAAFLQLFSARRPLHLGRFGSFFGLCGRDFAFSISCHVFTKGKFCGMRFSKNTVRRGVRFILQR